MVRTTGRGRRGSGRAFLPDGAAELENGLVRLRIGNQVGNDKVLTQWFFKPIAAEMIDVYYGVPGYPGHAFREIWDAVHCDNLEGPPRRSSAISVWRPRAARRKTARRSA